MSGGPGYHDFGTFRLFGHSTRDDYFGRGWGGRHRATGADAAATAAAATATAPVGLLGRRIQQFLDLNSAAAIKVAVVATSDFEAEQKVTAGLSVTTTTSSALLQLSASIRQQHKFGNDFGFAAATEWHHFRGFLLTADLEKLFVSKSSLLLSTRQINFNAKAAHYAT